MRNFYCFNLLLFLFAFGSYSNAQKYSAADLTIRGLCIAAPRPATLDSFITFINQELAPRHINTLIMRFDYHYQFKSHPELIDSFALSFEDVQKIVSAAETNNIKIIPQINLLGHQSWANHTDKLLAVYPQFDETPWLQMPAQYVWPNADSLYCKSYCPLHPEVHKILFDVIDEICAACHSKAFHAGMDEVFILGDDKCERCRGKSKAELFAGEVNVIHDHLKEEHRELWIWGDRLLDGRSTGVGEWEGSYNNTYSAIDNISKNVVICDWHYERADKTAPYFAKKGFRVITCTWRNPAVAITQLSDLNQFKKSSGAKLRRRYYGIVETVWSGVSPFLDGYYGKNISMQNGQQESPVNTPWSTFKTIFAVESDK